MLDITVGEVIVEVTAYDSDPVARRGIIGSLIPSWHSRVFL